MNVCDNPYYNGRHHPGHSKCVKNRRHQEARVREIKRELALNKVKIKFQKAEHV